MFDSTSNEKNFHPWLGYSIFLDKAEDAMKLNHGNIVAINSRKEELLDKTIHGIMTEGQIIGKRNEAQQLAERLRAVKNMFLNEIQACCVNLYTRDSFLYRSLSYAMRSMTTENPTSIWDNKIETLSPFGLCLWSYLVTNNHSKEKLYRGATLTNKMINEYISIAKENPYRLFQAFTSCTRNRYLAEHLGNTLFVVTIEGNFLYMDISSISQFPDECETLLPPTGILIENVEYDKVKKKHAIHLKI